ncbi:hypothetical protein Slin15195_G015960 [Septoria linicola]|uniref:Uncharacterized protein n=1 Tax=Septoria linicola TaxID=215465 RepID=A0A9Q9AFU4_9PEZI|nr:hypothetical protein Slin14017_G016020 [Septoria linicola]USW48277.1 hypothetical protein Slin15195_G015960 [Septoria linicola]
MAMKHGDQGAPSPPQENKSSSGYASYVPHDLKYDAAFEDAVMRIALAPPAASDGIRIIPEDSPEQPVEGTSIRSQDIAPQSLPEIAETDLPLPLDDARRIYASAIPGVKLTHPGGYLEGGPGLDPDMDTFPEDFLNNRSHVRTSADLRAAVDKEVEENMLDLRERMRKREQAIKENEEVEKKLQELVLQHAMELKVHKKLADDRRAKKEAKERRRAGREGG